MQKNPKPSPVKNTAGEGFAVEDAVAAWLACHLLASIPWPNQYAGSLRSIKCQMQQDGWEFDDFLVESHREGLSHYCACSVKSFPVFGKTGAASAELAAAAWRQWLGGRPSAFQRDRDSLVIFATAPAPEVREAWHGLLDAARVMEPAQFARRQVEGDAPSSLQRAAFASMRCSQDLNASASNDPIETARLLQKFGFQEHDFDHTSSQSVAHAALLCQQALADSARTRAGELWEAILAYAAQIRKKGGCITLPDLLTQFAARFPLKQHPDYASEWSTISIESKARLAVLPTKIGGTVAVLRRELLDRITGGAARQRVVVVLGDSGNGKSVLAYDWVKADENATSIWVRAADLACEGGLRTHWGLRHGLLDLCASAAQPARLVLDGLDRCFDEVAFDEAALLLQCALAPESRDRWQVLLTCCPDDWERVDRQLLRRNVHLVGTPFRVGPFSVTELRAVCQQLPVLNSLVQRPHLHPLLCWPKALDIVVTYWRGSGASPDWTTESSFARWFWRTAICQDEPISVRDRAARKLATQLADRLTATVRLGDFEADESAALVELAREHHVEIDPLHQTVRFTHDLVADWARSHELHVQGEAATAFLKSRLHSPLWHRAVRYYGLDLLEQHPNCTLWHRVFSQFSGNDPADEMARNLLLEAPVFALQQRVALEQLWPALALDEGALLRRFLRQFLRVATIPDERIMAHYRERNPDLLLEVAALRRLPWLPYWLGVLAVLNAHCEETISVAREELAEVCLLWLPLHNAITWGMKEAANLAVASARRFYRSGERVHPHSRQVSPEEKICQALLAAAPVLPDEVAELVLKLSGRRLPDDEDGLPDEPEPSRSRVLPPRGPPVPWAEGPLRPCAPVFRQAFMNGTYAAPFLSALPDIATEVLFATLLDIPRAGEHPRERRHFGIDEHGFDAGELRHESCFWTNGPFLTFLRIHPEVALPAIVRLVNFGTDRGLELGSDVRAAIEVPVTFEGKTRSWRGHQHTWLWHQGHVFGPRAVCCALLSVEKWFYLLMDAGEPLDAHIGTILRESHSIALASVLLCVGKRQPDLFLGPLRPLLATADFYWLESLAYGSGEGGFRATVMLDRSEPMREAWREWIQMPHRKEPIREFAFRMLLGHTEWREMFTEFQASWKARMAAAMPEQPGPQWLPSIVAQFDLSNWRPHRQQDRIVIEYQPPQDLPQPTPEETEQFKRFEKLSLLPFECRRVLMGEAECPEEKMAAWWAELNAVRAIAVPDAERGLHDAEDALCGIVAVAVVRHRVWLAANPAREAEALAILREVGERPPPRFWLVEDHFCDFKWDSFTAWAATTLWTERPEDPFLRQAVGSLALWDRYVVVERVLCVAAAHRDRLGPHFEQLVSHTIRAAPALAHGRLQMHGPQKTFDLKSWGERHLKDFLTGRTPQLPVSWTELPSPETLGLRRKPRHRQASDFDVGHINAALAWAEDLSTAKDSSERTAWLHLHRQSLLVCLCRIQRLAELPANSDDERYDELQERWPYDDESKLLHRIARIVARLAPGEQHRPFWEPIFALGAAGCHWIDAFVGRWLIEAAGHETIAPAFVEQWLTMLAYAETSPAWQAAGRRPWDLNDARKRLLGLSPFGADFWHAGLSPAVEAARSHLERWARRNIRSDHEARVFVYFLKTDAAKNLRLDGLGWLHEHVGINDNRFWDDNSTRDAIAGFLRLLLDQHWTALAPSTKFREAFMAFALKLAALQHPLGSEVLTIAANRLGANA